MQMPARIHRYRLLEELGGGGTGTVYRALDPLEEREVALKLTRADSPVSSTRSLDETAVDEFRLLASLAHPNLVGVHDLGRWTDPATERSRVWFTLDLIEGADLSTWLGRHLPKLHERADSPLFLDLIGQLLAALDAIHSRGLLHRDLKSENLLVVDAARKPGAARAPRLRLIDFGLALPSETARAEVSGTIETMSPERLREEPEDRRGDLFALGVLLYELLLGEEPFTGESVEAIVQSILRDEPRDLDTVAEPWRRVIASLLAKSAADRPPSAQHVYESLFGDSRTRQHFAPAFRAPFVGRARTLERLTRALVDPAVSGAPDDASGSGSRAVSCVLAPTGLGKSRLLREVAHRAQVAGCAVVRCAPRQGFDAPGDLLRRIVRALDLRDDETPATPGPKILGRLEEMLASLELAAPRPGSEDSSLERFSYRFFRLLEEIAGRQAIRLVVDDLHAADGLSQCVLIDTLQRATYAADGSISILAATRTETALDQELIVPLCREESRVELYELEGLDEHDIERFLESSLGSRDAFDAIAVSRLVDATGGNPLFLIETLELLHRDGAIERHGAYWRLRAHVDVTVPKSLEEASRARLGALDGTRRAVLELLAVRGRPLTTDSIQRRLLADHESLDPHAVLRAIEENLLEKLLDAGAAGLEIPHAPLRLAILEGASARELQRLHLDAARELLERVDSVSETGAHEIAHHLWHSSERPSALPWLLRSGAEARQAGAFREALLAFERARDIAPDEDQRWQSVLSHEETAALLGDRKLQLADLDTLEQLARKHSDPQAPIEVLMRRALYHDAIGEKRPALELLERALALSAPDSVLAARLLARRGMLQFFLAEFDASRASLEEALGIADREGDAALRAECYQLIGLGQYFQGRYDDALEHLEKAVVLRRALGDTPQVAALESNLGLILYDRGQLDAAEERFHSSLGSDRRAGFRRGEAIQLVNLGLVYTDMGRLERALDFLQEGLTIRREMADRRAEGVTLGNLGRAWLCIGRYERAGPLLEEARERAVEFDNRQSECVLEARLAQLALERADVERAAEHLMRAEEVLAQAGGATQGLLVQTTGARLDLLRGRAAEALERAEAAIESARSASMQNWTIECLALRAEALLALGRVEDADAASADAVDSLAAHTGWLISSHAVWWTRYRVLLALHQQGTKPAEPDSALRRAYTLLREKADSFEDPELRSAFLEKVLLHRDIDREHGELQRRMRSETSARERSFYEIARSLHSILEIDPLLDRLLELALETTRAEKGLILLRSPDGSMETRAAKGMPQESVEDARSICQSVIDDVASGGRPVLAQDATSDDRFRDRQSIISLQIRTLMCVPLSVRNEILGAVYVDGRGSASFTTDDLDYLVSFAHLSAIAVDNARLLGGLRDENRSLRREVEERHGPDNIICRSKVMEDVIHLIEKVARSDASVLVTGETGTGKSVLARALHVGSARRQKPFITVDCGALPENLLESELFGHKKGAFSGALYDRVGLIEEAAGGTLFLDEITNTSLDLQAKLLRVLQEGEIRRVGENAVRTVDVRIVAATNTSLREAVDEKRFREDLFYRLNVVPIEVPRLADRREDILPLARFFLEKVCRRMERPVLSLAEDAIACLENAPWRGNVRELENTMEKLVILADSDRIDADFLESLLASTSSQRSAPENVPESSSEALARVTASWQDGSPLSLEELDGHLREAERHYLIDLVERAEWNLSRAARMAEVRNRNNLVSRLKKHGIRRPEGDQDE